MRIGVSIFLIALGAILRFALETSVDGINLDVTGVILMVVGAIGLVLSMAFWTSVSPARNQTTPRDEVVREVPTERVRNTENV